MPFDIFIGSFLNKVSEYEFLRLDIEDREQIVDKYMRYAISEFSEACKYDLSSNKNSELREYSIDIPERDIDELVDIISEGMVVQWMKQYVYNQEVLENVLNTRDFTSYSPAEMLHRLNEAYKTVKRNFTNMIREYSYKHGDLTDLHL